VAILSVRPCAFQPRKDFAEDALRELADSIKAQGILSPLIVRARSGGFELIAGERRWRAAQLAGLKEVPIIVREADDRAVLELALIENLQRENLNPIEEALGNSHRKSPRPRSAKAAPSSPTRCACSSSHRNYKVICATASSRSAMPKSSSGSPVKPSKSSPPSAC
jgi:ParB/RepB/Spo0J family partition protein